MSYVIRYSAAIDWKKFSMLPRDAKRRLKDAIERKLMIDPLRFGKPLRQSLRSCRSLRVGAYRIIYRVEGKTVDVLLFGHRSNVYGSS